jgi:hypothetical protein
MPVGSYAFQGSVLHQRVCVMRRIVGLIVIAVLALTLVAGCGGGGTKATYQDADRPR